MINRVCDHRGLLVDGKTRLPSDPSDYFHEPVKAMCGCNRLYCERCKSPVRVGPGEVGLKEGAAVDLAALYSSPDWLSLPFVEERKRASSIDNGVRLYACRCATWQAERVDLLDNEHDSPDDPNLPWLCSGHPAPTLPVTLDNGLTVGPDIDWAELVGKILGGACPRSLGLAAVWRKEGPSSWLGWLHAYLAGLPVSVDFSAAIGDRVADEDPSVVGAVLYFFSRFPRSFGVKKVIERAEKAIDRIATGYLIPDTYVPTMWDVLVARLEQPRPPDELDARVTELVQRVCTMPLTSLSHEDVGPKEHIQAIHKGSRVDIVANALERSPGPFDDPDMRLWLADHIVDVDAAAPGRWKLVMTRLTDWHDKPALGHLIVIAGTRLIQSGRLRDGEFEEWVEWRRQNHGWMDDAWILPLQSVLAQHLSRTPRAN
jgi:hypothetical protein